MLPLTGLHWKDANARTFWMELKGSDWGGKKANMTQATKEVVGDVFLVKNMYLKNRGGAGCVPKELSGGRITQIMLTNPVVETTTNGLVVIARCSCGRLMRSVISVMMRCSTACRCKWVFC